VAAPAIGVTPNTALRDGQAVSVSGTGFVPNLSLISVMECTTADSDLSNCDISTVNAAIGDASGAIALRYHVFRVVFTGNSPGGVDCAVSPCFLTLLDFSHTNDFASQQLHFDASVKPPPTLEVTAKIDRNATLKKSGVIVVKGKVSCTVPVNVHLDVTLTQSVGSATAHAAGSADVACKHNTKFVVATVPTAGTFSRGRATVALHYHAFIPRQVVSGDVTRTVRVHGHPKHR
jgi:hypothetical protein